MQFDKILKEVFMVTKRKVVVVKKAKILAMGLMEPRKFKQPNVCA